MLGKHHPLIRRVRALRVDRRRRDAEGVLVAEGVRLAAEALDAGAVIERAIVSERLPEVPSGSVLLERLRAAGVELAVTSPAVLDRLQDARSPQPVLVVVRRPEATTRPASVSDPRPWVVTVGLQDPGNLGAILRTAVAAGAGRSIAAGEHVDPFHPRAVRASAGAVFRLWPETADDALTVVAEAVRDGRRIVGACAGGRPYDLEDWTAPFALFLGAEGSGLPREIRSRLDVEVGIPTAATVESLSVGAAAAVLLFEARRHRHRDGGGSINRGRAG